MKSLTWFPLLNTPQGNNEKALGYYEKALAIWKKTLGEEHPRVALALNNVGMVYQELVRIPPHSVCLSLSSVPESMLSCGKPVSPWREPVPSWITVKPIYIAPPRRTMMEDKNRFVLGL